MIDKETLRMTPKQAWLYAAEWGSLMRNGDPGACMYGFDERARPQSEEHRKDCLRWIDEECKPLVEAVPGEYDEGELDKLAALRTYLENALVDGEKLPSMIESYADLWDCSDLGEFTAAYFASALWSETDEEGEPLDSNYGPEALAPQAVALMREDCADFWKAFGHLITAETCLKCGPDFGPIGHAGHDFCLTRNRHGAGFWDGDWHDSVEKELTEAAHAYGEFNLYVGDDGLIYCDG